MKTRLKQLRKALGLTQIELSNALGAKNSLVGMWESGAQPIPTLRIEQICNKYKVNRDWLERGVGEMFAPSVDPDEEAIQRRLIGDIFESLRPEKQKLILEALRGAFAEYLTTGSESGSRDAAASNTVSITAPVRGAVTIDQKIEKKD